MRHEAGKAHRVDRDTLAHPRRRGLRRPGRRIELRLGVELDDRGARERSRSLFGEAHHQHSAEGEVRRVEARHIGPARQAVELVRVESGRPHDKRHPGLERKGCVR